MTMMMIWDASNPRGRSRRFLDSSYTRLDEGLPASARRFRWSKQSKMCWGRRLRSEKQSLIAIYRQSANDATNHGICDKVGTFFVEKQVVCWYGPLDSRLLPDAPSGACFKSLQLLDKKTYFSCCFVLTWTSASVSKQVEGLWLHQRQDLSTLDARCCLQATIHDPPRHNFAVR